MTLRSSCLGFALLVAGAGCGSNVIGSGGGDTGGGGTGGGNTNPECTPFRDQSSTGEVTFRFVNQTGIDIYLPASCDLVSFQIDPAAGPDGSYYGWTGGACSLTCEDLQSQGQIYCDAGACAPSSFRVPAGGSLDIAWDQLAQKNVEMPSECWFEAAGGPSCNQIVAADPGQYRISITAYDTCASDPAACGCDATTGLCSGDATGLSATTAPVIFGLPSSQPVEVIFDPCAFGCATPPSP